MATITKEILINADADKVWSALSDFGALHTRLATGFVTNTELEDEGRTRVVTFSNGSVAREILVGLDNKRRRIAYAIKGSAQITQHSASAQIFTDGPDKCRFVWTADVLPDAIVPYMNDQMDLGAECMKRTLEGVNA